MDEDEFRSLSANEQAVNELFHQVAHERLSDWVDLAEERLAGTGKKCYVTGGNDDDPVVLTAIKQEGTQTFFACENEVVQVDEDHTMISVGYSTPTPWKTPREISDEQLGEMIEEMIGHVTDHKPCNF